MAIRPNVVDSVRKLTEALGDESKSQQLELLITQDRSVSALMDKTLGSSSVVTSANLSILWEEMIHPHLEGVRQQGAEVLKAEQEKAKKKLEKAKAELVQTRQLGEAKESALAAELKAKLAEDLSIIEALCGEVDAVLKKSRKIRIGIGAILALLSWIPSWLSPSTVSFSLSGLTTVIFAYLTATGGKIIGVDINQEKALLLLQHTAKTRRLESKLVQFDVLWTGKSFMVSTKAALSQGMEKHPTDLFGGPK